MRQTIVGADGAVRPSLPPALRATSHAEGGGEIPRLRARRGDEGIAPYEKATGNPCVGADAHIRPKHLTHTPSIGRA